MTGNQYFIVILAGILAYFIVNMVGLYVRNKEATNQTKKIVQLNQEQVRLHMENMKQLEVLKEMVNGKSNN